MTSTAVVRSGEAPALKAPKTFGEAMALAEMLAHSELVPKDLRNKPHSIVLVGAMGAELGVSFVSALSMIDVIEGRPTPSAQLLLAMIRRHGHEARFAFTSDDKAVLRARRGEYRDDPEAWVIVEFTAAQAEKAGYLDEWVERKYRNSGDRYDRKEKFFLKRDEAGQFIPAEPGVEVPEWVLNEIRGGRVKRMDPWHKRRANMLRARAASDMFRMEFSDLRMGGPLPTFDLGAMAPEAAGDVDDVQPAQDVDDPDDEIVDAEIVQDGPSEPGSGVPEREPAPPEASTGSIQPEGAPAPDRPDESQRRPLPLPQQIAMQAQKAGVERAHVIAAVTGGQKTSAKDVTPEEGGRVLRAIHDIAGGYLDLVEISGQWCLEEAAPADDPGRPFDED